MATALRFVIVPKVSHPWFDEVNKGAQAQAEILSRELGVEVAADYRPPAVADVVEQNAILEQAASSRPSGIAVDPVDAVGHMTALDRISLDAAGGPIQRWIASLWLREKDALAVARFIHSHRPKDVIAQWEKVKNAQGLAFIAPVYWCHFPAIMKGWFERVFSYGDAYGLTMGGWRGEMKGRVPLLHHDKALIINTTLFSEENYTNALAMPMKHIIDDWGLRYPGVKKVEHVYFYQVSATDDKTRQGYLERAYELGKTFSNEKLGGESHAI